MLKEAYTTQELMPMFGTNTESTITRRAEREGWISQKRNSRGGGKVWLISSMPELTRTAINAALARETENLPAPIAATPADIVVPDYAWNRGKARYRIVQEWKAHVAKSKAKGVHVTEATELFISALLSGLLLPDHILKAAGAVSQPTLYRWDKTLREHGQDMEALADKRGGWLSGKPKGLGQIGEEAEQAFLGVHLKPNQPSMQYSYNCMALILEKKNLPVPSYSSVRRFYERFDSVHHDLTVWMREGEKAYTDKIGNFLSRDDSVLEVGDVLVADGHKMNFLVINPETGKGCRMTLVGWQDWKSRMFVGFDVMINENTQVISSSLFHSIINLGKLPKAIYRDNGKAFKNKFFDSNADIEEFDGLYSRLGIYVQNSAPYVARTKIIERWWGDFDRQCEVGLAHYLGASIEDKPAYLHRNEKWHKDQQNKSAAPIPTIADVARIVTEFARWKAFQPHPTMPGTTPYEVFMAGRGEGFPVEEAEKLSRQFLYRKPIHPKRCRFILNGLEFEHDALHGINKQLSVHYSYADLSQVYVYDDGRLLCTAKPVSTVNPLAIVFGDELDMEAVKAGQKRVAALRRDTRKQATALAEWGASSDVLNALPWQQPAAERKTGLVLRGRDMPTPISITPDITDDEALKIKAITETVRVAAIERPAYQAPAFFGSRFERYEFLFLVKYEQKLALVSDDAEFMADFENSQEFETVRRRYDQLLAYYNTQTKGIIA